MHQSTSMEARNNGQSIRCKVCFTVRTIACVPDVAIVIKLASVIERILNNYTSSVKLPANLYTFQFGIETTKFNHM